MTYRRTHIPYTDDLMIVKYVRDDLLWHDELFSIAQIDNADYRHCDLGRFERWAASVDDSVNADQLSYEPADRTDCGWYACMAVDKASLIKFIWEYNINEFKVIDAEIRRLEEVKDRMKRVQFNL